MANAKQKNPSAKIDRIGTTSDVLTSRGGLALFARYLEETQVLAFLQSVFGCLRKSKKGQEIAVIFKQLLCFMMDGTSRHLTYFDHLQQDKGYAASLELGLDKMLSSHSVKRFFTAFSMPLAWSFRRILRRVFLWRLQIKQPDLVVLGVDSMVMDNDEAAKRHGVQPTYKRKTGFHPVQMTWNRLIVDAVFRGGSQHCHHGHTVANMVRDMVKFLRKNYREDVPIVVVMDSGFCDQNLFQALEALDIGYICSGKVYDDLKEYADQIEAGGVWGIYKKNGQQWKYFDLDDKRKSWTEERRTILCQFDLPDLQLLLQGFRPLTVLYTNLGMGEAIDRQLQTCGCGHLLDAEGIIQTAHGRGKDELVHRALKAFAFEELPFLRFAPNTAVYYTMVLAHFLYESFQEDVCGEVIPVGAYANTLRRKIIDLAAKIVRTGGEVWIKFTESAMSALQLDRLWQKCLSPPQLSWG